MRVVLVTEHSVLGVSIADALDACGIAVRTVDPRSVRTLGGTDLAATNVLVVDASSRPSPMLSELLGAVAPPPGTRILVLTDTDDHGVLDAFAVGADAYLPISASLADVEHSVRALAAGERTDSHAELNALVREARTGAPPEEDRPGRADLTHREAAVLRLLVEGATTEQIARTCGIAPTTVRSHVQSIFGKLGVHSRLAAVAAVLASREEAQSWA